MTDTTQKTAVEVGGNQHGKSRILYITLNRKINDYDYLHLWLFAL